MDGNILVDGVLASCYASADHDMAHFGMSPIRLFPEMIEQIIGEDNGFQVYAIIAEKLGKWMLPSGSTY